ncbi:MAG: hypothetical protein MI748_13900 [Opitutales bacterium]|nr:hypothetical protein [Opitutales bacterium]
MNPEDARLLYRYSKILAIKGDLPLSTEKAEQAAHHRNSHWFYTAWLSDLNLLEGDKEEAQKNLRVAIRELRADIQQLVFSIVEYEKNLEISGVYTETGSKQRTGENFVVREISEYFEAPEVLERSLAGLKKELAGLEEKLEKIQA